MTFKSHESYFVFCMIEMTWGWEMPLTVLVHCIALQSSPNKPQSQTHNSNFLIDDSLPPHSFVQYVNTIPWPEEVMSVFPPPSLPLFLNLSQLKYCSLGAKAPYLPIITLHPSLGPALGVKPPPGPPPDTRSLGAIIPCSPSDSFPTLGVWVRGPWAEHYASCES